MQKHTFDPLPGVLLTAGNQVFGTKQLMEQLHLKHRPGFRKNYLLPAIENGWVVMSHPESPNSPKQTYRLSAKGRAIAESLIATGKAASSRE